jgi:RNA polymerase nonessential primary-like sigma factor
MARYMSNSDVMKLFEDIDNIKADESLSETAKAKKISAIQDKMIKGLSFLVYSMAKRYRRFSNYEDLTQEGFIGLLRAVRKFNRNLFPNFFVYSERWIRHSISRAASRFDIVYSPNRQRVVYSDHSGAGEDELVDSPEEEFIEKEKAQVVRRALGNFCDRDREIVERVFGLNTNNPQTLRNIGPNYNLTHERIRQIKNQVIEKLKGSEELGKLY